MKKIFSICLSLLLASIVHAQGAYGDAQVFNVTYSDGGTWVTGTHSFTKNGYTFTITQGSDLRPTQSKGFENVNIDTPISKVTYTGALKCRGVEISEIAGLGQITLPFHNASSGSVRTIQTQIFDGNNWITVESISLPGNGFTLYRPSKVISKSAVKIKFVADGDFFFYGIDAYSHKDAANAANPPSLLSATPAENAIIPGAGSLFLQFDELIKEGSNLSVTLGNATITKTTFLGNTLQIDYTDFTNATNPLAVTKTSVADYSGTELSNNISVQYAIDITPPAQTDIAPADGSGIHVGDLGEYQRKIKITFDENIKIGTGSITFGSGTTYATVTATVDENILIVSYSGLPYNSTCVLTIPNGYVTDLSGNAWAGDTYTYTTGLRDTTPPELVETSVGENEELPVRGSISFSFDEIVVLGDAQATVDGQPVTLSNNGKVIGLNYTASSYYGTIIVTIPPGCVTDTCGNSYSGKSFDFLIEQKTPKAFNAVVASDGSGNYSTIQAAIDAITDDSQRTLIYVKAGTYSEKLCVWKNNVSLIGEDADKVFIVWDECASTSTLPPSEYGTGINTTGTDASFTMLITGNNFYGENFTVRNDYDYVAGTEANKQAVALEHKNGDKHVLKNVKMYSFQDTYYPKSPNTRQYLTGCYILGGTDFIFGSGTTFINNSEIYCYPGGQYITAASDTDKEFGIIIANSEIKYGGMEAIGTKRKFYLGRPWKAPAKTAYINNTFESGLIQNEGWSIWSGTDNHLTATYAEYGNMLADGSDMDVASRVDWSIQLTEKEAVRFNPDNAFNYGANNVWNPLAFSTAPDAITTSSPDNGNITWDESLYAVGYIIFKNGTYLATTASNSAFTDAGYADGDIYHIAAYNEYGAMSALTEVGKSSGLGNINAGNGFLVNTVVSDLLKLQNTEGIVSIEIVSINGQKVFSTSSISSEISIAELQPGFYFVTGSTKDGRVYVDKIIKK